MLKLKLQICYLELVAWNFLHLMHQPTKKLESSLLVSLHPSSFILHPPSSILHPPSFILHPSTFILHPPSFILHPPSSILHPLSFILHPPSYILYPTSFILYPSSFNLQQEPSLFDLHDLIFAFHPSFFICSNRSAQAWLQKKYSWPLIVRRMDSLLGMYFSQKGSWTISSMTFMLPWPVRSLVFVPGNKSTFKPR